MEVKSPDKDLRASLLDFIFERWTARFEEVYAKSQNVNKLAEDIELK